MDGPRGTVARHLARRTLLGLLTLLAVAVLTFVIGERLVDPAVTGASSLDPSAIAARRAELGLDRPLLTRLGEHLGELLRLELGTSRTRRQPVTRVLGDALTPTLAYAIPGFLLAAALALLGGTAAARREGRALDRSLSGFATILAATSALVIVALGQLVAARHPDLFAAVGWPLAGSAQPRWAHHLALPVLLWAAIQVGPDLRHVRALMVESLAAPHIEALRARGLAEATVLRHALRHAAGGLVARLSLRLPQLVAGSVVIETVFNVPGLGEQLVTAVLAGDGPLLQGVVLLLTLVTVVTQPLFDLLAAWLDPRLAPEVRS